MNQKALILLSGGLDSLTCLAIAKDQGYDCHAISFSYGQRHDSELSAAIKIANHYNAHHQIVDISDIAAFGGSALTDHSKEITPYSGSTEIPNTYVPARNLIFLSIATSYAESHNIQDIFIGVSSVDYSGYPDCRPEFIQAFQNTVSLGTKVGVSGTTGIQLVTPIIDLSKAQTIQKGVSLGVDYSMSVSCYQANVDGKACGICDSCVLRKKGFNDAGIKDPTRYLRF